MGSRRWRRRSERLRLWSGWDGFSYEETDEPLVKVPQSLLVELGEARLDQKARAINRGEEPQIGVRITTNWQVGQREQGPTTPLEDLFPRSRFE